MCRVASGGQEKIPGYDVASRDLPRASQAKERLLSQRGNLNDYGTCCYEPDSFNYFTMFELNAHSDSHRP
jgi:hypothetical protein